MAEVRYAVVKNGIVENLVVFDDTDLDTIAFFADEWDSEIISLKDREDILFANIGNLYDGQTFLPASEPVNPNDGSSFYETV